MKTAEPGSAAAPTSSFPWTSPSEALRTVERISEEFGLGSLAPQIRSLSSALRSSECVDVAVVGRFKAGKSSLINSLIGADVLPVDVLPATSVITRICHGRTDQATVRFLDGRIEGVGLERLAEVVTERRNPENVKQVGVVDVELTSLEPFPGVRFVDTPGLGSIFSEGGRISKDWLPEIGAAIVALSFDPPLSEDDLDLLTEVTRFTPEVTIVLTKVDLAAPGQVEAVEAFMHAEIGKRLDRAFPILAYSVRPEFCDLQNEMKRYLVDRLVERHDERQREILGHKLERLVAECRDYLGLALSAARAGEQARAGLLALVKGEDEAMTQTLGQIRLLAVDLKKRAHEAAAEGFLSLEPQVLERVRASFEEHSRTWEGNLSKTSQAFQTWAQSSLGEELAAVSPRGPDFVAPFLEEGGAQLGRIVRAFQDRLSGSIEAALEVRFSGTTFEAAVTPPCSPDIRVDKTFDIPLDMVWFLVPMFIFRPLVYWRLRSQLPWEVEKNLTRLAWQWTEAATSSIESMSRQARDFMTQEIEAVSRLASGSEDQVLRVERALAELDEVEGRKPGIRR